MRVVLDTNILISALLVQSGHSAAIYLAWQEGYFTLLVCAEQIDELRATLHKPAIAARIMPHKAGRLVNQLKHLAEIVDELPQVRRSPDPTDDNSSPWLKQERPIIWSPAIRAACSRS